jgi:hypothetical protein
VLLTVSVPFPTVGPAEAYGWAMVPKFPTRLGDLLLPGSSTYDVSNFLPAVPDASPLVAPAWWAPFTGTVVIVFKPLLVLALLTIWVGTVVRLVRARPPRRQQLAWVVCAVLPLLAASLVAPVEFANVLVFASLLLARTTAGAWAPRWPASGSPRWSAGRRRWAAGSASRRPPTAPP